MPYVLSPIIDEEFEGLWNEGMAFSSKNIYSIKSDQMPPIHYDEHLFRPHSLPHVETEKHTVLNGKSLDHFFNFNKEVFYGECLLIKFNSSNFIMSEKNKNHFHWEISLDELKNKIFEVVDSHYPLKKLAITIEDHLLPKNRQGLHDPNYAMTLSFEAAQYLTETVGINAFLTSWKSSDYKPQSRERPIHNLLFKNAIIYECLNFQNVPEGIYFLSGFPIPVKNASESVVCPIFFETKNFN